ECNDRAHEEHGPGHDVLLTSPHSRITAPAMISARRPSATRSSRSSPLTQAIARLARSLFRIWWSLTRFNRVEITTAPPWVTHAAIVPESDCPGCGRFDPLSNGPGPRDSACSGKPRSL